MMQETPREKSLLVLGGTSDIGRAAAAVYAAAGWSVTLAVRNAEEGARDAQDLTVRYGKPVKVVTFDARAVENHVAFVDQLGALPDTVVCVVGILGDQTRAETDLAHAADILRANFEGPALLLGEIANRMAARGRGTIVGVSSVAGDRGRAVNYVYGSAKAGMTAFLSGLRNRLAGKGVRVVTVLPGFVRTRMTAAMKLTGPLTAEPEEVGRAIHRAAELRPRDVIYVRPVWRLVMFVIRSIPEAIFKRLRL